MPGGRIRTVDRMSATAAATTSSPWSRALKLALFGVVVAIVWFRVVPEVRSAARNFDGVRPWLVAAGITLQVTAWATYSVLTRASLRNPRAVSLGRLARIQVTTQAVGNTVPGASAVGPALTHRMLARSGVASSDAAVALGTATFTSALALNAILAFGLLVSIPFRGVNGPYLAAAATGAATIVAMGGVLVAVARQAGWTLRAAAWVARRVRRDPVAAELAVMVAGDRLAAIAADGALLRRLAFWAVTNWLLDAASLWCFLAAFGHAPGIDGLLVAFGVANVLAAVPVSPGGAGVVEWAYLTTLSGFGLPAAAVSLGVVAYRCAQALLPTVVGGVCYVSLVRGPWAVTAHSAGARDGNADESLTTPWVAPQPRGVALPTAARPGRSRTRGRAVAPDRSGARPGQRVLRRAFVLSGPFADDRAPPAACQRRVELLGPGRLASELDVGYRSSEGSQTRRSSAPWMFG